MTGAHADFRFVEATSDCLFVVRLYDEDKIAHARKILRGDESDRIHVRGTVICTPVDYNPAWSFHLDPDSIDFFELAIEVCDASARYVEENLEYVGGAFLPQAHWCPWSSRLIDEVGEEH